GRGVNKSAQPKERERAGTSEEQNVGPSTRESGQATEKTKRGETDQEKSGAVSQSTTVFRNGKQTSERLTLHRSTRERTDVHFSIGTHPRDWWLRTYTVVVMDSCPYYLADDGCWYPAYGFEPGCNFPEGVVYCE